jgi:hypothetical protein
MGLSVVVYIQLAASGDKIRLHGAANQFQEEQRQTRHVLVAVVHAPKLDIKLSVLLHQPAIHLSQNEKLFCRDSPALCDQRQILPPLHVGLASARWLLPKPPKLAATKRHPVGHL